MRGAFPALLALAAANVHAQIPQPSCYAGEAPCTQAYVLHFPPPPAAPTGLCVQWYEPAEDDWAAAGYCLNYVDLAPDVETGSISNMWLRPMTHAQRDALWAKQITRPLEADELVAWEQLLANKPSSLYAVPAYRGALDRPTYPLIDGARGEKPNGRIPVGAACFPSVWQSSSYAAINTQAPYSVAVCARR